MSSQKRGEREEKFKAVTESRMGWKSRRPFENEGRSVVKGGDGELEGPALVKEPSESGAGHGNVTERSVRRSQWMPKLAASVRDVSVGSIGESAE